MSENSQIYTKSPGRTPVAQRKSTNISQIPVSTPITQTQTDTQDLSGVRELKPGAMMQNVMKYLGNSGNEGTSNTSNVGNLQRTNYHTPVESLVIQPKLTIGRPNDRYEQEADRVADHVVRTINAPPPIQRQRNNENGLQLQPPENVINLQRQPRPELMMKPLTPSIQRVEDEEKELMPKRMEQGQEAIGDGEASTDLESSINSAKGGGQPLDEGLQGSMGEAMGADFSGVRVHTDSNADQLNQSIQAKAFTTGQDLFFKKDEYQPGSKGGQELIAHELTHVVQQSGEKVEAGRLQRKVAYAVNRGDLETAFKGEAGFVLPTNAHYAERRWGGPIYESIQDVEFEQGWTGTLAIVNHGSIGKIGDFEGDQIADVLITKHLPQDSKVAIEFLSCNAGTQSHQPRYEDEASEPPGIVNTSLVETCKTALVRNNYNNVTVSGSKGLAFSSVGSSPKNQPSEVLKTGHEAKYFAEAQASKSSSSEVRDIWRIVANATKRGRIDKETAEEFAERISKLSEPIYIDLMTRLRRGWPDSELITEVEKRRREVSTAH